MECVSGEADQFKEKMVRSWKTSKPGTFSAQRGIRVKKEALLQDSEQSTAAAWLIEGLRPCSMAERFGCNSEGAAPEPFAKSIYKVQNILVFVHSVEQPHSPGRARLFGSLQRPK